MAIGKDGAMPWKKELKSLLFKPLAGPGAGFSRKPINLAQCTQCTDENVARYKVVRMDGFRSGKAGCMMEQSWHDLEAGRCGWHLASQEGASTLPGWAHSRCRSRSGGGCCECIDGDAKVQQQLSSVCCNKWVHPRRFSSH